MAFSLAFSQAPPDHPFVGEFFPVQLTLIDGDHEIHGGIELPLSLELYYEEKDKQVSKGVFEVVADTPGNYQIGEDMALVRTT